jgi:hypothetical protein
MDTLAMEHAKIIVRGKARGDISIAIEGSTGDEIALWQFRRRGPASRAVRTGRGTWCEGRLLTLEDESRG